MTHLILLDRQAVAVLANPRHPRHRQVVAYAQVLASRKRRAVELKLAVPTSVRGEAGWDRTSPEWAFPNQLRIADSVLDAAAANAAAAIRRQTGVSVPDAHIGAAVQAAPPGPVTVLTSDPDDIRIAAGDRTVTIAVI